MEKDSFRLSSNSPTKQPLLQNSNNSKKLPPTIILRFLQFIILHTIINNFNDLF